MAGAILFGTKITQDYNVQSFEDDIKKALLAAGTRSSQVVFILKDEQVTSQP